MADNVTVRARALPSAVAAVMTVALVAAVTARADSWLVRPVAADQARAKGLNIRLADLGASGWTGGPQAGQPSDQICPGYPAFHPKQSDLVVTGGAMSIFSRPDAYVDAQIVFLRTSRMVELDWTRSVESPKILGCLRSSAADFAGTDATVLSISRLALPALGRRSAGFRAVLEQRAEGGKTKLFVLDYAVAAQGRVELSVSQVAPYDRRAAAQALETRLLRVVLRRLASA